ncbi:zinc ABC transporter substrate-binding protein [Yoonia sp. 2307UL14-13]|uniref:zinc ABC transporter substrate-binding protein n=1 Tax=Yoonia sp. 2307UL14-13 TaxID=3126506 RepID=UPI0030A53689
MIRLIALLSVAPAALCAAPNVMTDFAPVHSLTAQVMGDVGTPNVLLPPGADPHDFAMRPSDGQRLSDADLVIWVGDGLTPWLEETLDALAPGAARLTLLDTEGWERLPIREAGADGDHDDHNDHDDHDDHEEHASHDDHGHDDHADHDDHAKEDDHGHEEAEHAGHDHHDHGDFDPHAWTDPAIAKLWLATIADALSEADPENAKTYAANAVAAAESLDALDADIAADIAPVANAAYILPHDGYQYFEVRYGLNASAAISGVDGRTPGPAQVAALRDSLAEQNVVCVFSDVAIGDRWATVVIEDTDLRTVQIDAIGAGLDAGPDLYAQTMRRLADGFVECLGG